VLDIIRDFSQKAWSLFPLRHHAELTAADVAEARHYIADYWAKLERYHPKDDENLIGLPKPYLVPSYEAEHEFDYDELYYWDSYFMVQSFLRPDASKTERELVLGILDDLIYLFERFKIIPNASRLYLVSRSQPPFLTSFIWDVYEAYGMDKEWLGDKLKVAEEEYKIVWMGTRKPNARAVYRGLSRYYDFNYLHDIAEIESGWDMTPRFGRKALNYLAVDLNALLYKYETDFVRYYRLVGDKKSAAKWALAAKHRRNNMHDLMWSNLRGMYFDYNFVKQKRGTVASLAGLYPLWAGMVDEQQALQMVRALKRFENPGGLSTTDAQPLSQYVPGTIPTQWAYPNGWAPLHYLVIKGLERYGYHTEAKAIAMKWLRTNLEWFNKNHVFLEKYNVVQPEKPPLKGVYPSQTGFGWTNAVFERLCQEYIDT
jgi:alpha,alpha-trehalase